REIFERSAPVMHAAVAMAIPDAADEVTQPASAPVASAMARQAARWSSSISQLAPRASAAAAITSGGATFAPTMVDVPRAFTTRCTLCRSKKVIGVQIRTAFRVMYGASVLSGPM